MNRFRPGERLGILAIRAAGSVLGHLPLASSQRVASRLSRAYLRIGGRRMRWALANLGIAFPSWSASDRRELALQSAENLVLNLIDLSRSERWSEAELLDHFGFEGLEYLVEALGAGHGAILLSLHMGCYDLGVRALSLRLPWLRIAVVAHPQKDPQLERWLHERRNPGSVETIATGGSSALRALRVLRTGRPLILLSDLYMRSMRQVVAPLFGRRCHTPSGPALLAQRAPAPILPCYVVRAGPGRHVLRVLPPLALPDPREAGGELAVTTACNAVLEGIIRKYPEHWTWAHRRFRHSPDVEPGIYRGHHRSRLASDPTA